MTKKNNISTTAFIKNKLADLVKTGSVIQNYVAHATGLEFLESHYDTSIDRYHSPKARDKILSQYADSIKVKPIAEPLKSFTETVESNIKNLEHQTSGFEELLKTHKDNQATKLSILTIEKALAQYTQQANAIITNEYIERLKILHELIENDDVNNPKAIAAYVQDQYQNMMNQLSADKNKALKEIEDQLSPSNPAEENALSDQERTSIKAELIKRTTESYDKTLQAIETAFQKGKPARKEGDTDIPATPSLKEQFNVAVTKAESELVNLVLFSEETSSKDAPEKKLMMGAGNPTAPDPKKYRDISFEEYLKHQPERSKAIFDANAWHQYFKFLMNNKAEISTPSGLRLKHDGQNGIEITIPNNIYLYHKSQDNHLGSDLMFLANEIKAQGKDEITITITIHDPKLRQKIMEEAYYAAKLAGFPDEKIKFNVPALGEDEKQSIQNKTANELGGQLGSAMQRAANKAGLWQAEQQDLDNKNHLHLRHNVDLLADKIEGILTKPMNAQVTSPTNP